MVRNSNGIDRLCAQLYHNTNLSRLFLSRMVAQLEFIILYLFKRRQGIQQFPLCIWLLLCVLYFRDLVK